MVTTVDEVTVFSQEKVKSVTPDYAEVLELPEEERMGKRVEIYNEPQALRETKDRLDWNVIDEISEHSAVSEKALKNPFWFDQGFFRGQNLIRKLFFWTKISTIQRSQKLPNLSTIEFYLSTRVNFKDIRQVKNPIW